MSCNCPDWGMPLQAPGRRLPRARGSVRRRPVRHARLARQGRDDLLAALRGSAVTALHGGRRIRLRAAAARPDFYRVSAHPAWLADAVDGVAWLVGSALAVVRGRAPRVAVVAAQARSEEH